ncbi:MAG: response regulator [Candidatus Rokubacteria bacterium]|nr:response regulator [Candidatus Rokubacteria bacterium]
MLVVEDDHGVRLLLVRVLEAAGAEVTAVETLSAADKALAAVMPDVVVSDLELRNGEGFRLLRQMRARSAGHGRAIPVVAISGVLDRAEIPPILAAGVAAVVLKPFEPRELVAVAAGAAHGPGA